MGGCFFSNCIIALFLLLVNCQFSSFHRTKNVLIAVDEENTEPLLNTEGITEIGVSVIDGSYENTGNGRAMIIYREEILY